LSEPPGRAKSNAWIFNEIGKRIAPQHWFKDVEECLSYQVRKGKNMDWKKFSKNLVSGVLGKIRSITSIKPITEKGRGSPLQLANLSLYQRGLRSWAMIPFHSTGTW
jgi:hypothetical protein